MTEGKPRSIRIRAAGGLTLVELLVVLAVASVLMVVAVPALQSLFATNELSAVTDNMASALSEARSEAAKLNSQVALTPASGTGSVDWTSGWTMAVVNPAAGMPTTLRSGAAVPAGFTLKSSAAFPSPVTFDSTGKLVSGGPLEFVACKGSGGGGASKMIIVAKYGGVRLAQTDTSGYPIDVGGSSYTGCAP